MSFIRSPSLYVRHAFKTLCDWRLWVCLFFVGGVVIALPVSGLPFELPKITLLSLGAFLGVFGMLSEKTNCIHRLLAMPLGKLTLFFFAVALLSPLWSIAPVLSIVGASPRFEGAFAYILYFAWMLIGMHMALDAQGRQWVQRMSIAATTGVVLYGFAQLFHADPLQDQWQSDLFLGRSFSTLGQPTILGLWLVMMLPILWQRMVSSKGIRRGLLSCLLVGALILTLATVSRAAFLGVLAMILIGAWWHRSSIRQYKWLQWIAVLVTTIALLGIGSCFAQVRFSAAGEDTRSSSSRLLLWKGALKMIASRPLGYGLDTVGLVSASFLSPDIVRYEPLTVRIDRAHSQILDLLLTLGWIGTIAFYMFVLALLTAAIDTKKPMSRREASPYALAVIGSSLTLLFVFHTVTTAVTFFLCTGVLLGILAPTHTPKHSRADSIGLHIMLILLVLMAIGSISWIHSSQLIARANRALDNADMETALALSIQSIDAFALDRTTLIDALETQLTIVDADTDEANTRTATEHIKKELLILQQLTGGMDGMTYLLAAWKSALYGDGRLTEQYITIASMHSPGRVTYLRIAAHCFALLGEEEKAQRANALIMDLLPSDWQNPVSQRARILQKENPWLEELK